MEEILMFFGAISSAQSTGIDWYRDWNMWMTFATALAAFFTAWNVWETKKSVRIAHSALILATRPYLSFGEGLDLEFYKNSGQQTIVAVRIPVKNVGQVPLMFKVNRILANNILLKRTDEHVGLFPGNETHTTTSVSLPTDATTTNFSIDLRVEYEYWSIDSGKHYSLRRTFEARPHPIGKGNWSNFKDDFLD